MQPRPGLGLALIALGAGVAAVSLLGPLAAGAIEYHISDDLENQVLGGDVASLVLVAPLSIVAGVLALRGHPAAPVLALGLGGYAAYLYAQYVIGAEYFRYPGNSERFFPLLLAVFILGAGSALRAWGLIDPDRLPPMSPRTVRLLAGVLVVLAVFLVFGLHLPGLVDALGDEPSRTEYVDNPSAFWIVKLMDLGIVVPAALAAAAGLLAGAHWARKAAYGIVGWLALLGAAVAGMAIVMQVNDDPDASIANVVVFSAFAAVLIALAARLYWPLLAAGSRPPSRPIEASAD